MWAYNEQRKQKGKIKESEEECVPGYENHSVMRLEWTSQELHHDSMKQARKSYLQFARVSLVKVMQIMRFKRLQEERKLNETSWQHRDLSLRNSFSRLNHGSFLFNGRREYNS
ncbi:hypothetical protein V8C42DRAFT_163833 [Trichoderma barbatum]